MISLSTQQLVVDTGKQTFAKCEDLLAREWIGRSACRAERPAVQVEL